MVCPKCKSVNIEFVKHDGDVSVECTNPACKYEWEMPPLEVIILTGSEALNKTLRAIQVTLHDIKKTIEKM